MNDFSYKEYLYYQMIDLKHFLGYRSAEYGINIIDRLKETNIIVGAIPFKTQGLRGMAFVSETTEPDSVVLNSKRSDTEQNFDCGHEAVHLTLHRHLEQKTFNCFDKVTANQDPYVEWQANEGSAEFFVPHQVFIPLARMYLGMKPDHETVENFKITASKMFSVPPAVIKYRLESLKYEIYQYYTGIKVIDIKILSHHQQEKQGIYITSLNHIRPGEYIDMERYIKMKNRSGGNQNGF